MLSTALVTGLSLAIYALTASATSQNQLIATNLAREGIEVARMMRDSNWLAGDVAGGSWDLQSCPGSPLNGSYCYPNVFTGPAFNFNNGNPGEFDLSYDSVSRAWSWQNDFFLYLQPDGSYSHNSTGSQNWLYSRKIKLSYLTSGNYSAAYPALVITSIVGWKGRNCIPLAEGNGDPENTNCKVTVEERLTNWKDYK